MVMTVSYNPVFVALSIAVAIFASYVALDLGFSVTQAQGRRRAVWLACGALAMGIGIWSMHFIGMLAFEMPGMEMGYDLPLFSLSILIAVVASAIALWIVSRPKVRVRAFISGGLAMAVAIAGMHYTGMYSMRMGARIEWNLLLVALSVVIAMIASFAALFIAIRLRNHSKPFRKQFFASILMGLAIAGMHYTGMAAATFFHSTDTFVLGGNLLASHSLGIAVTIGTLMILGLALTGTMVDRMLAVRTKRAERSEILFHEAKKAVAELERERELRERFVSAFAHDLRTPLTAAKMSSQLALKNSDDSKIQEYSSRSIRNLQRMDQMIQDLLDAHRISAGQRLPLERERFRIKDLLESTIDDLTTVFGDRFEMDVDGPVEGYWDSKYMRRAIENLLSNAVKYGREDSKVKVIARSRDDNGVAKLVLAVHNKGEPLALEDKASLFELFNRGRSAQTKGTRGWGLGLTIVKGVSEAHGGKVDVHSSPEGDTVFTIDVPSGSPRPQ
jgi:diguanylate cyclase